MTSTSAGPPRQFWEITPLLAQPGAKGRSADGRTPEGRHRRQQRRGWVVTFAVGASGSLAVAALAAGQVLLGASGTPGTNAGPPSHALRLAPSPTLSATAPPSPTATAKPTVKATPSKAPGQNTMHQAIPMRTVAAATATVQASVIASAQAPTASPASSGSQQPVPVTVKYLVVTQAAGSFEAEVTVTNAGSAPIVGWQIVVTLPEDTVTSFSSNATGEVSDKILLLTQAPGTGALAAGGTLQVFFTANGFEQTPTLCAFNNVACG